MIGLFFPLELPEQQYSKCWKWPPLSRRQKSTLSSVLRVKLGRISGSVLATVCSVLWLTSCELRGLFDLTLSLGNTATRSLQTAVDVPSLSDRLPRESSVSRASVSTALCIARRTCFLLQTLTVSLISVTSWCTVLSYSVLPCQDTSRAAAGDLMLK
jgi:hypothetical protein